MMIEQPVGPDLEAAHIEYVTEDTHVDKADAWDRNARKNSAIKVLREALESIRDGYGPNHLSKFARDTAANALSDKETE